jgi:hypothetical protein
MSQSERHRVKFANTGGEPTGNSAYATLQYTLLSVMDKMKEV